ncbi:NAD(P)/FAD-dependent oxidoreductase [Paenibacillus pini]|uniref:FAD dependent oxidoreductase domain-containing protein n=1 Tax=Paenibacillus pini JCM 16418 TaxID=1236976 RepID=W7YUR5_9BACL|nr:FAD-dependent oxidoreductase [Paenibacillus pini]GAF06189.1 hypothetical protein JCM16418_137 [Paenibacillus pini JCM 16418]
MILNNGNLAWPNTLNPAPQYPELEEDLSCDCLIIGGGMGGALLAHVLSERNIDTVLVEKNEVGNGSSSANTGLLQFSNDKSLTALINTFGEETAVSFYKLCRDAMTELIAVKDKLVLDPQLIPRSSLYFATTEEDVPMLKAEYDNLVKYGFDAEYWDKEKIESAFPFSKSAALYTHGDAEVNPYRMVHALSATAAQKGVKIYEHSEIVSYEYLEDGVICHTKSNRIHAKRVIFAMGYETQEFKTDRNAVLETTYAIVTNPVEDLSEWHERCLIWETERPYFYIRTTPEGRIVAGGLDETLRTPEEREIRLIRRSELLLEEIQSLFPNYKDLKIDYAWSSIFGSTHDGLPMIGTHPKYPNCYFLEGYGGNGTVYSMMAAQLLADEVTGTHRPEMEMFSLTRTSKPSPPKPENNIPAKQ